MTETRKTLAFLAGAAALAVAAAVVQPETYNPSLFSDEGEEFYPDFREPQLVRSIEVLDYDESTATVRPLKVEFRKNRWVIASNHDYPVDIGDRLVKTSAALIDLKRDQVRSEAVQDHGKFGVIDPLDQSVTDLQGRGKRVTLRDGQGNVLADYILGKPVEDKPGWRYIRVPKEKRTYAVQTDADPSARFADWVNAGLLNLPADAIRRVLISGYSIDEFGRILNQNDILVLTQEGGVWRSDAGQVKEQAAKSLAAALAALKVVDARPKPEAMARDLRAGRLQLSMGVALELQSFGFLLTQTGRVLGTGGEIAVELANGVAYQMRFGDVAVQGAASADAAAKGAVRDAGGDRYLFVTTSWDAARAARYGDNTTAGEKVSRDLNARFAGWFYAVSNADYKKLKVSRADLLQ
jgi:hypothetical protein